jgi:phage terminase large subunit-like protein
MAKSDTFPHWIFDNTPIDDPFGYGERAVRFLKALKHPKSRAKSKAFTLDVWQERIVRRIYGPCHADGRRIVRNVTMLLPRGNRKTSLGAGLALLHSIGPERVDGGQTLFAASDRKQAKIGFDESIGIIRTERTFNGKIRIVDSKNRIFHDKSGNVLEAISCDAGTQHGRTPNFALVDELHAWKKRDLWDVIRTALVKIPDTLLMVITTAGRGQENLAYETIDYARKVARGEIHDPATLPILFETSQDADWTDEAVWHTVNPGLAHGYPDLEGLRQLAREGKNRPAEREAFRQLHLNVWLDHSADPFIEMSVYDACKGVVDIEALRSKPCWLAVDLSSNSDLTTIQACWRDNEDNYVIQSWFFCPADNLKKKADKDGVPYPHWATDGFIIPTAGNVVDFRIVEQKIRDLCDEFDVQEVAFDPHLGRNMMQNLLEDGYPVVEMRQGWVTMAPAIKELEKAIIGGTFVHDGNPVLRWNFSNIAVETDKAENRSFHKGKSKDRIDGAVACAMAIGRASQGESNRSVYSNSTARPDGLLFF